jgi:hypothetical protein
MILENLTSFDAKYLELFYVELFSSLDFESLSFSKDISKQFLPNFAIVPNFGVVFIYEQTKFSKRIPQKQKMKSLKLSKQSVI